MTAFKGRHFAVDHSPIYRWVQTSFASAGEASALAVAAATAAQLARRRNLREGPRRLGISGSGNRQTGQHHAGAAQGAGEDFPRHTAGNRGEVRLIGRVFGIARCAMSEAITMISERVQLA